MQSLFPYTPRKAKFEDLKNSFVGRHALLDELIDNIRDQSQAKTLQHWMILGSRGLGKSHVITLVYHMVKQEKKLNQSWLPILMNEEEQGIFSLHTLFIRILTKLGEELANSYEQNAVEVDSFLDSFRNGKETPEEIFESSVAFLKDHVSSSGKKLLVLMENADDVFSRYLTKKNEIKKLRKLLQHENFLLLLSTSPTFFEEISSSQAPLYEFFRIRRLELLNFDQAVELLNRWSAQDQKSINKTKGSTFKKDDYRLQVLYHLTGGNPRILLFLYLAVGGPEGIHSAVDTFTRLLEEDLSNYYLSRMRDLSNQVQPIVIALAENDFNMTQTEIAQKTFLPPRSIGTAVMRLENDGIVKPVTEKKGKNTLYALTDQLFRLWYRWRTNVRDRQVLSAIVEFLAVWYRKKELQKLAIRDDLTGTYSLEALKFRQTQKYRVYWESFHEKIEEDTTEYLKQRDFSALFDSVKLLDETGYDTDPILDEAIKNLDIPEDIEKAHAFLEDKMEEFPDNTSIIFRFIKILFLKNDLPGVEKSMEKLSELHPDIADVWSVIGAIRVQLEEYDRAEKAYSKATELEFNNAGYWFDLGTVRTKTENDSGAETAFVEATKHDPGNVKTWLSLGLVRVKLENDPGAEEAFRKAVEIDPSNSNLWYILGLVHSRQKNYKEAEQAFTESVNLNPEFTNAWINLGLRRGDQGSFSEAEQAFAKAVELDQKVADAWFYLGLVRLIQKDNAGSEDALKRIVNSDFQNVKHYSLLVEVMIKNDQSANLLKLLRKGSTNKSITEDLKGYLFFLQAFTHLFQQDTTPARRALTKGVKIITTVDDELRHSVLGELSDLIIELVDKDGIEILGRFIGELGCISEDIAAVFVPINHVLDYFNVLLSEKTSRKSAIDRAQRILDSITSEIRGPVEEMIEKVKKNLKN